MTDDVLERVAKCVGNVYELVDELADEVERLRNTLGLIATARIPSNARGTAGIDALQDLARMALLDGVVVKETTDE